MFQYNILESAKFQKKDDKWCLVFSEGLTVKVVFSMTRTDTLEGGDVASNLSDGLHLLLQVVALNEVSHLRNYIKKTSIF